MSGISLSSGIRNSLFSLQDATRMAETVQTRLATGKRVNSALDNPTNFFTAANLTSRSNDLNNLMDSMSNAVKTIEAADNGVKAITRLAESMQSVVRQAREANAGAAAKYTSTADLAAGVLANTTNIADGTLALQTGSGPTVTFTTNGKKLNELVNEINGANTGVRADVVNSRLSLTTTNGQSLTIDVTDAANLNVADGTTAVSAGADPARLASLGKQFNDLRTQIQQAAKDAGFNGVNLLNAQGLTVQFNEKTGGEASSLSIAALSYGDTNPLSITAIAGSTFDGGSITAADTQLTDALKTLRADASTLGANLSTVQTRQDFTRAMVKTLKTGADNLVLADQNEEAANLLTLQTRQQLSQQTLSLASQQQQGVLRLLG
jgi:flagellin-like hook-associated protein FlgL